jgi:hypothetical protein
MNSNGRAVENRLFDAPTAGLRSGFDGQIQRIAVSLVIVALFGSAVRGDASNFAGATREASQLPNDPSAATRAADDYLLMPRADVMRLPTSGSAWASLKEVADATWGNPDLCNQDVMHAVKALAGALVSARTGDASYYNKTRDAIISAIGTERSGCRILSIGRQLAAYVLAADFIKLSPYDDDTFRSWLSDTATRAFSGHGRWQQLSATHAEAPNNWGAFAGASRIAASLYLGDTGDVSLAARVLRGFLGDRTAWDDFKGQGNKNIMLEDDLRVWACDDSADGFVPINPPCWKGATNLDGAIVGDVWRDEFGLTWPVGPTGMGYTLESLQGLVLQTELLYRNGYLGAWDWSDAALRRVAAFITRNGDAGGPAWKRAAVDQHLPWLLNYRYGLDLPLMRAEYGRTFGYTDWLYGEQTGPEAVQTPSPRLN